MPNSAQSSLVKAFEPSSCAAARRGPNALMPAARKIVDEAGHQRRLGADHHETDRLRPAEGGDRGVVAGIEGDVGPALRRAGIARRDEEPVAQGTAGDLPGERVLAPARADEKDVHWPVPLSRPALEARRRSFNRTKRRRFASSCPGD